MTWRRSNSGKLRECDHRVGPGEAVGECLDGLGLDANESEQAHPPGFISFQRPRNLRQLRTIPHQEEIAKAGDASTQGRGIAPRHQAEDDHEQEIHERVDSQEQAADEVQF